MTKVKQLNKRKFFSWLRGKEKTNAYVGKPGSCEACILSQYLRAENNTKNIETKINYYSIRGIEKRTPDWARSVIEYFDNIDYERVHAKKAYQKLKELAR